MLFRCDGRGGFDARRVQPQTLRIIGVLELGVWGSPEVSPKVFGFGPVNGNRETEVLGWNHEELSYYLP